MRDETYPFLFMTPIDNGILGQTQKTRLHGPLTSNDRFKENLYSAKFAERLPSNDLRPWNVTFHADRLKAYGDFAYWGKYDRKLLWASFNPEIPGHIKAHDRRQRALKRSAAARRNQR